MSLQVQEKSEFLSQQEQKLNQDKEILEKLRFEITKEKNATLAEKKTIEGKRHELAVKTKAFEAMRHQIGREISNFEEEKGSVLMSITNRPRSVLSDRYYDAGFNPSVVSAIHPSASVIDPYLKRREVSPLRMDAIETKQMDKKKNESFSNDVYIRDLERLQKERDERNE